MTTGWVTAIADGDTLAHERIVTDPEWVWDRYQSRTLPAVYDYVMDRHDGNPRGGGADAPFFGTLTVELELSEPDYRLGVDNEIISTMDALHEEVYFGTIEFFHLIGRNARGQDLTYPGRIIPVMRPKGDGEAGRGRVSLTGFATDRPAVVVRYTTRDGASGERRLDIPRITMERPSLRRAVIAPESAQVPPSPALPRLDFRVRVDSEADERDALLIMATPEQVDARMISAQQVDGHACQPGHAAGCRPVPRGAGLRRGRRDRRVGRVDPRAERFGACDGGASRQRNPGSRWPCGRTSSPRAGPTTATASSSGTRLFRRPRATRWWPR